MIDENYTCNQGSFAQQLFSLKCIYKIIKDEKNDIEKT